MLRFFLDVMIETRSSMIYRLASDIALTLMMENLESFGTRSAVTQADIAYEALCWLHGITGETVVEFCSALTISNHHASCLRIEFARAWKGCDLSSTSIPDLNFSVALAKCLNTMHQASDQFCLLSCQVVTMSLLHHSNPLPLAVITAATLGQQHDTSAIGFSAQTLLNYAKSLVAFSSDIHSNLQTLMENILPSRSNFFEISGALEQAAMSHCHLVSMISMISHLITISSSADFKEQYLHCFCSLLPIALQV